jgi:hypothetical protein
MDDDETVKGRKRRLTRERKKADGLAKPEALTINN